MNLPLNSEEAIDKMSKVWKEKEKLDIFTGLNLIARSQLQLLAWLSFKNKCDANYTIFIFIYS